MSNYDALLEQHMKIVTDLSLRLEAVQKAAQEGATADEIMEIAKGDIPMTDVHRQRDHYRLVSSRLEGRLDAATRETERWRTLYQQLYAKVGQVTSIQKDAEGEESQTNIEMRDHSLLISERRANEGQ